MSCTRGKWRNGGDVVTRLQRPGDALHMRPIRVTVAPMLHASGQSEQAWSSACLPSHPSDRGTSAACLRTSASERGTNGASFRSNTSERGTKAALACSRTRERTVVPRCVLRRPLMLMQRCYAAGSGLVRLVGRLPVAVGALSDTAALGNRGMSVLQCSCSARDEGRWCLPAGVCERAVVQWC